MLFCAFIVALLYPYGKLRILNADLRSLFVFGILHVIGKFSQFFYLILSKSDLFFFKIVLDHVLMIFSLICLALDLFAAFVN